MKHQAYKPDVVNGYKIYNEIDRTNGANIDYTKPIIIPYSWNDFTDLVQYERDNNISPQYSSMIAINLMKRRLSKFTYYFESQSCESQEEAFLIFLDENYIQVMSLLPKWDIESGVFFDKYYDSFIHDAKRASIKDTNTATNGGLSIDYYMDVNDITESQNTTSMLEYNMLKSCHINNTRSIDEFKDNESIFLKKEKNYINNILFKSIDENKTTSISKKMATTTAFIYKFLNNIITEDRKTAFLVSDIITPIYEQSEDKIDENEEEEDKEMNGI